MRAVTPRPILAGMTSLPGVVDLDARGAGLVHQVQLDGSDAVGDLRVLAHEHLDADVR